MQDHEKFENKTNANSAPVFASDKPPAFETPAQKVLREWEEEEAQAKKRALELSKEGGYIAIFFMFFY